MTARVLELGEEGGFPGIFGKARTLAWPVYAYRMTLPAPVRGEGEEFNALERVILAVLRIAGKRDETDLASETCLPPDLIRNVILRLRSRGVLDADNGVSEAGYARETESAREAMYVTALAFRERVGGAVLPFVMPLDGGRSLRTRTPKSGSKRLRPGMPPECDRPPAPREVLGAVTQMTQRAGGRRHMPPDAQIRVLPEPEEYILECKIGIQRHDADWRIKSPWGEGCSPVLETAFARCMDQDEGLQRWMLDWRRDLEGPRSDDGARVAAPLPFDTPDARRLYPELIEQLRPAKGCAHRSLPRIYGSLEWALFYACMAYNTEIPLRRLLLERGEDHSEAQSRAVASLGFDAPQAGFQPVSKPKIDAFRRVPQAGLDTRGTRLRHEEPDLTADLETVLAVSLLQAEKHPDHPLRRVAEHWPDLLVRLRALKQQRDALGHGTGSGGGQFGDEPLESDAFMVSVVGTLLPSLEFKPGHGRVGSSSHADRRLEARTSLLIQFGHNAFSRLGPTTQEALLGAELFWQACEDGDDALDFVIHLYSAIQGLLFGALTGVAAPGLSSSEYLAQASRRGEQAGLGPLPPELQTVNISRVRDTLHGSDRTLGASTIVLLLKASDEYLQALACADPGFLATIGSVHCARGHGNRAVPMTREAVGDLRRRAFASIAALLLRKDCR